MLWKLTMIPLQGSHAVIDHRLVADINCIIWPMAAADDSVCGEVHNL